MNQIASSRLAVLRERALRRWGIGVLVEALANLVWLA